MSMFEVSVSVFVAEFEGSIHFIGKISYEGSTCGSIFLKYVVSIPTKTLFSGISHETHLSGLR